MVLLHGYLDIQIISGADLGKVKPKGFLNRLSALALQSGTDPYVSVALGGKNKYFQSRVINNSSDPVWESSVLLDVCHELDFVELRVKGAARPGIGRTRKLGRVELPADELVQSGSIEGTYNLVPYGGDDDDSDAEEGCLGSVTVKMRLLPLDAFADRLDVPGTYFPLRTGCQVRLYQDAHVDDGELPAVDGSSYTPGCCFRDMSNVMEAAQDFIYITGWSVFTEVSLLRERHGGGDDPETLGVFLKRKAEEGVQVRIMVWDELMSTSGSVLGHDFEHKGMMMTHDEETREYFSGVANVVVVKAARKNDSDGPLADFGSTAMFTHHQKTIICDAEPEDGGDKRRLVSFVGGLDLTNGRFDTPTHSLFRSLATTHRPPDFHQACVTVGPTKGPREPWHDQAGHVSAGAASWDVLQNFTERWRRQAGDEEHALVDISGRRYVSAQEEEEAGRHRQDGWNVQILRSINEASAMFEDNNSPGLFTRRRALIDQSIHHAYIHHVRRSKKFLFFENQYWLGSSTHWLENKNESADHLLPVEIAMRVARAITAHEPYHAYIMIPLFPEGPPASGSVQEILAFQYQTFAMMYRVVAQAIRGAGTDEEPLDRLSFYFSAIRETERGSEAVDDGEFENETEELLSQTRRHSVYCHSKAVIIDDAITIIGSANCNSRSMDGARDSEIAFAAYQPAHVCGGGRSGNPSASGRDLPPAYAGGQASSRSRGLPGTSSRGLPEGTASRSRGSSWGDNGGGDDHDDDDDARRRRHQQQGRYGGGHGGGRHGSDDDDDDRRRRHGRHGSGSDDDDDRRRRHGRHGSGSDDDDDRRRRHGRHGSGSDDDDDRRRRHGRHGSGSGGDDDDRRRRHGRHDDDNDGRHSGYGGGNQQQEHASGYGGGGYGQTQHESGGYGGHQQASHGGGYGGHQQASHGGGYGGHQQASHGGGYGGHQQASYGGGYGQPQQHQQSAYGGGGYGQPQQESGGYGGHQQASHGGGYGQPEEHQQGGYGGGGDHHQSGHGGGYQQHQQGSYGADHQSQPHRPSHASGGGGGGGGIPRGDIHSFRLNLFGEHLNCYDPVFEDPSSIECVRKVREIAEANWEAYVSDEVVEMHGWCPYPIEVSRSGRVSTRVTCFPDTEAKVAGADGALPDILTT